jgi:hypothetical protein
VTPTPPPAGYRWEVGYQAYYHNPGSKFHGMKVVLGRWGPCGQPGWEVRIVDPKPGMCDEMAVDEKALWIYV